MEDPWLCAPPNFWLLPRGSTIDFASRGFVISQMSPPQQISRGHQWRSSLSWQAMRLSYKGGFYTHEFTSRELSLWFYHDLYKERLKLRNLTQSNKISSYLQLSRIRLHFWTSLGNFCKYIRQDAATNNLSQKKEHFLRMKFIPYNSNCLSLHIGGSSSRFGKGYFSFLRLWIS